MSTFLGAKYTGLPPTHCRRRRRRRRRFLLSRSTTNWYAQRHLAHERRSPLETFYTETRPTDRSEFCNSFSGFSSENDCFFNNCNQSVNFDRRGSNSVSISRPTDEKLGREPLFSSYFSLQRSRSMQITAYRS